MTDVFLKSPCKRRGYTLVFFAMFLFGFMALAALVIDVGFARLTQRQMQTAVDAAALEGLRFRDEVPDWLRDEMLEAGVDPEDAENPDYARRWSASRIVAWTFDDNLNPDDGDLVGFGAGPLIELGPPIPGAEDLNAGQLLRLPETPFYKPVLQSNLISNERHGDMVAGRYTSRVGHKERANYERDDFEPDVTGDAFLVRMRRSNDFEGLDNQQGVSSHEFPIPYLFGRGAFFPAGSPNRADGYSPRHHGMTVRATGIADARPVLSVGLPNRDVEPPLTGLVTNETVDDGEMSFSFVLELGYWKSLPPNEEAQAIVKPLGELEDENSGKVVGRFYKLEQDPELRKLLMPLVIGREPPDAYAPEYGLYTGYVPIYSNISDDPATTNDRVVGFGEVTAEFLQGKKRIVEIKRWPARIAPENASAAVCYPLRLDENELTSNDLNSILKLNDKNKDAWILAPVSVR